MGNACRFALMTSIHVQASKPSGLMRDVVLLDMCSSTVIESAQFKPARSVNNVFTVQTDTGTAYSRIYTSCSRKDMSNHAFVDLQGDPSR